MRAMLARELFSKIAEVLVKLTKNAAETYGIRKFLFAGGVASSEYIENYINNTMKIKNNGNLEIIFAEPNMAQDNAVGIALLGAKAYGDETR